MPFGNGQLELHAFRPPDRDAEASRFAVEPVGLVLRLEDKLAHVGDGGSFLSSQPSAMGLQDRQGDLEGGRDVLFVDRMPTAQDLVGGAGESGPRLDVLSKGDADRLIHEESELAQEPVQRRGIPPDWEYERPMDVHGLPKGEAQIRPPEGDARK